MLMAKNSKNEWVHANLLNECHKYECYYCPDCSELVKLKIGKSKIKHFAHQKKCQNSSFSEGETQEHLLGKFYLYQLLSEQGYFVELEPYINAIQQRPDLLCYNEKGEKVAIEFQCSPISVDCLKKRTKGYLSVNCPVIWIVGSRNSQLKNYKFAYYQESLVVFYLNVELSTLFVQSNNRQYQCMHLFRKNHNILRVSYQFQNVAVIEYNWYRHVNKLFLKILYQLGVTLDDIPKVLFLQQKHYNGVKSRFSECLILVYILLLDKQCTLDECLYGVKNYMRLGYIQLFEMPLVNYQKFLCTFVQVLLKVLCESGYVILDRDKYRLKK